MKSQQGQIVIILILVTTVALAIGISVIGRSLSDISTSSKVEQSSRAFSAAEAGIEKAIQTGAIASPIPLGNSSTIQKVDVNTVPAPNQALEYPRLAKEEVAQAWLADPETLAQFYNQSNIDIYWGNDGVTGDNQPAVEITVTYQDTANAYKSKKYFLDLNAVSRNNGFDDSVACPSDAISTSLSATAKTFFCKKTIDVSLGVLPNLNKLILLRARLLYNNTPQSFAVRPTSGSLPTQAKVFISTGTSGETLRKVQVFRQDRVVPPYFDYGIFSIGEISK